MLNKVRPILIISLGGFFLFVDQFLKYLIQVNPDFTFYFWRPWLGIELFFNQGIAFSIPIPNWLIIFLTPILFLLLFVWVKKEKREKIFWLGVVLILSGAISNFIDRIMVGAIVDYFRILTAVINLADVVIVVGAIILFFSFKSKVLKQKF